MTVQDRAPHWLRALHDGDPNGAHPMAADNLAGMLQGWAEWPDAMDFLDPGSPNHRWKALMTVAYRSRFESALPAPRARLLDLACGSGRFVAPLGAAGHDVVGIDATRASLEAAARHAPKAELIWGDVAEVDQLVSGPFDAALAIELLCYVPDPEAVLRAVRRLLRPGAPLILSVEAWPGALLADPRGLSGAALAEAIATRTLRETGVRCVRCFGADELVAMVEAAGFAVETIEGTHHVLDGPLVGLVDPQRLDEPGYEAELLAMEDALRVDELFGRLARAWLVIARAG